MNTSLQGNTNHENARPPAFILPILKLPLLLYRTGLGWLLGYRFMLLRHVGRRSGKVRRTVLAVLAFDPKTREIKAISAWSARDWYKNILKLPALQVDTGFTRYVPAAISYPSAKIVHSSEPTLISSDIATTGVISYPEVYPISLFNPKGYEQGLVINVAGEGLVMITGCGHPTMERLVSRAEILFGKQVVGVVGRLHYEKLSTEDVQPHIQFLAPRQPKLIALSPHDSSPEALDAFQSAFSEAYQSIRVGEAIQFP